MTGKPDRVKQHPNQQTELLYAIRRSQRASRARIVVKADKVEVIAPAKISERYLHAFVAEQHDWIRATQKRLQQKAESTPSLAPVNYGDGAQIPYQGRHLSLTLKAGSLKRTRILLSGDQLAAYIPSLQKEDSAGLVKAAIEAWMKQQARSLAVQQIERHAPKYQLWPRSLRIKTQKSRWGSCGPQNDINLNWLLALAPPDIMEYVVVHELCHIRHKNHSGDFWGLVEAHLPNYQQKRRWLKQHGASLMRGL